MLEYVVQPIMGSPLRISPSRTLFYMIRVFVTLLFTILPFGSLNLQYKLSLQFGDHHELTNLVLIKKIPFVCDISDLVTNQFTPFALSLSLSLSLALSLSLSI